MFIILFTCLNLFRFLFYKVWWYHFFVCYFAIPGIIVLKLIKRDSITELGPLISASGKYWVTTSNFRVWSKWTCNRRVYWMVIMLLHFTLGIFLASKKLSLGPLLKSVPMYVIFLRIFIIFQNRSPNLINTTMLIGYAAIFLVLASLGIALAL